MSEEHKAVVRRYFEQVWNQKNLDVIDEIFAPDFVSHGSAPGPPMGLEDNIAFWRMGISAFPDAKMIVEDQIAEGDKVAVRWTFTGTHSDDFMDIPATGKQVVLSGIDINRIAGGQIVEIWAAWDQMTMLQQLGVIPPQD